MWSEYSHNSSDMMSLPSYLLNCWCIFNDLVWIFFAAEQKMESESKCCVIPTFSRKSLSFIQVGGTGYSLATPFHPYVIKRVWESEWDGKRGTEREREREGETKYINRPGLLYLVYNGISNIINCGNNNDNNSNVVIDNIDGIWLNVWSARQRKRLQVSSTARKAVDETFMIVISNFLETIKRVSSQWCSWFTLARILAWTKSEFVLYCYGQRYRDEG